MVLKLLILVVVVLVVFEGRMIYTMFTTSSSDKTMAAVNAQTAGKTKEKTEEDALLSAAAENEDTDTASDSSTGSALGMAGLAGLASAENVSGNTSAVTAESSSDDGRISEELDSAAVVPEQDPPVDDYYFNDAVFIGDSRMEGFRNTSGITQGEFLTSVGMTLTSIGDTKVNTSDGQITVYQGLSGRQYGKIYLMLGANDLGI